MKKFIMSYSCGKDSTLALYRMIKKGNTPAALLVTVNKEENRFIVDKYPVYSNEQYYFEDIDLNIGDTFKVYDSVT